MKKKIPQPKVTQTVAAIKEGTVIDHIPSEATFPITELLKLNKVSSVISIATNLKSKRTGSKGLIKIADKDLTQDEVNKLAILAPKATVNIISNYKVKKKLKVHIPESIENIVKCSNPNCITNKEPATTKFSVVSTYPLKLRCYFCERIMGKDDIVMR